MLGCVNVVNKAVTTTMARSALVQNMRRQITLTFTSQVCSKIDKRTFARGAAKVSKEPILPRFCITAKVRFQGTSWVPPRHC